MALVIADLESKILAALNKQSLKDGETDSPEVSRKELAKEIAIAVDAYLKTATVNTTVTGTSATGGPVTGVGVGTLS